MTLVELLVAMVIGLGVTLAVASLLVAGENHKRTTTSTNDAEQTGAYAVHALDRALRGAGSAIAESADFGALGCLLNVFNGAKILPRNSFPPPFAANFLPGTTANLRVAPLLIGKNMSDNKTSDVLVVMGGSGAAGGVPHAINGPPPAPNSLVLESTVGFFQFDLALISELNQVNPVPDCLLEEVLSSASPTLNLGTAAPYYYTVNGAATNLGAMAADTTSSYVIPLGNAQANDVQFQLFGVDANYTLYSYDLLQNQLKVQGIGADASQPIADGVIQMNAIYGIVKNGVQNWANPVGGYDITSVMTDPKIMKSIIAVRVALVVRGEYYDKKPVSPAKLTIFNGLTDVNGNSLSQPVDLTGPGQNYRYRVFEFTVPLRNMLILAGI
jgi:type IV pilus assembly protein PilW